VKLTRRRSFATRCVLLVGAMSVGANRPQPPTVEPASRQFEFTYEVHIPANPDAKGTELVWIPVPASDAFQDIRDLHVASPVKTTMGQDPEYGNAFTVFAPTAEQAAAGFAVTMKFHATRREQKVALDGAISHKMISANDPQLQRYLQPDRLVPLNGTIAELAKERTAGDSTQIQKARHIYEYVVSTMRYDKTGEGWGRGDAVWACTSKRGNCTDFHSLFIAMMRASGIPARFEIGFPLPAGKTEGEISGYHCWAEFYLDGVGWVPVDASEAWKNPAKHDYFFGAQDSNRVFFTYGRDIRLSADQKGDRLNYFIYPYAEINGQAVKNLQTRFSFREVTAAEEFGQGR